MLRVTGEVVRVERKPWEVEGRHGVTTLCRVLVGRADFVDVKFPEAVLPPREGDIVDLAVIVLAKQRGGGVDVKAVRPWSEVGLPAAG